MGMFLTIVIFTESHVPSERMPTTGLVESLISPDPPLWTAKPPPNPNFAHHPMASIVKQGLPQPPPTTPTTATTTTARPLALPPIRYAAAAAAAVTPTPNTPGTASHNTSGGSTLPPPTPLTASNPTPVAPSIPPITPTVPPVPSQDHLSGVPSSPSLTHPSVTSPMLSSASVSHQPDGSFYSGQESPALSDAVPSSLGGPAATSSPQRIVSRKGQ